MISNDTDTLTDQYTAGQLHMNNQFCIIIPCYNHSMLLQPLMEKLISFNLPIIIINDGSDTHNASLLEKIATDFKIHLVHHSQNQGKGMAMITGFQKAYELGFSHGIQLDADGQHNMDDVPKFVTFSQENPATLISGVPIYDDSIPKGRLYSRYITHFWVWIETLSFTIKDSMCGFRVYPLKEVVSLIRTNHIGRYMDFDTEIMVKLYWQGMNVLFIPTEVIYPEKGISHFRMVKDNILISWMHTRLVFGMIVRLPKLLWRKCCDHSKK